MKKGFVLTLDAAVSVGISILIFSIIAFMMQPTSTVDDGSLPSAIHVFSQSADAAGIYDATIAESTKTYLTTLVEEPNDLFCLNVTITGPSSVSEQTESCTLSSSILYSSTSYVYYANNLYKVSVLGWKS